MKKYFTVSFLFIAFIISGCGRDKANTQSAPIAPANLLATVSNERVDLKWDTSAGATSYSIYYKISSDPSYVKIGSTAITADTITGLISGETYYFAVTASNEAGASGYSNQAGITLISAAPATLSAIIGDRQVSLGWKASRGATGYTVYSLDPATSTSSIKSGVTTATVYTVTGLINGNTYHFAVTAVNAGGESGYSNEIGAVPVLAKIYSSGGTVPVRIAIDSSNNVWVTNFSGGTVTKINSAAGLTIGTYDAGKSPGNLAIDTGGNVWIANTYSGTVTELNPIGTTKGVYTVGGVPEGIAIDSSGNVWVADTGNGGVVELSPAGTTIGTYEIGGGFFVGIAIDSSANVWVVNQLSYTVTELNLAGAIIGTYGVGATPMDIAIDPSGNIWVINNSSGSLTTLSPTGKPIGTHYVGISPESIAIDSTGNVWFANYWSNTVTALSPAGIVLKTYMAGTKPEGVAIDDYGDIWVANSGDNTVTELVGVAAGPQYFPYKGPQWP